jgi:hypothetical protein
MALRYTSLKEKGLMRAEIAWVQEKERGWPSLEEAVYFAIRAAERVLAHFDTQGVLERAAV